MSGGHWNYQNDQLCNDIYDYNVSPTYGEHDEESRKARRLNPMEDRVISELVYDVFCLLHSYDWYASGDTCQLTYLADVQAFKEKWLKLMSKERAKAIVDDEIEALKAELYQALLINKSRSE